MKRIEKITPKQEAELPLFRQKYLDLARDGKRIDRSKLETAILAAYEYIGKQKPLVVILQSPQQAMMAITFFKKIAEPDLGAQLGGQLGGQLWDQLRDQLGGQLWDHLRGQLGDQLRDHLWDQLRDHLWEHLWDQLRDQLGGQLWVQLWDQLGGQLWDHLRGQLGDQLWDHLRGQDIWDANFLWGSQDLYWICWPRFAEKIGVKLMPDTRKRLGIMEDISTQCEWWWPYEGICFVSEKPTLIKWDDRRLHSEVGPAVQYEDGYSLYAWRGVTVPKDWIEDKKSITPETALTWRNVEQRRCAAEILGWHNVLEHPSLNKTIIDTDEDPEIGQLIEVSIPDIGREKFLKVQCGTGRTFALPCPPEMKTALEAQAWLNFCTPEDILSIEFRT